MPWMSRQYLAVVLMASAVLVVACGGGGESLPWVDDFSDPASGWQAESDAAAEVAYYDGVMRVLVKSPNSLAWAYSERELSDFGLTVEATQVSGPDDNEYGVLVRVKDPEHFYRFSISGDGYYLVSKHDGEEWEVLSGEDWASSEAIHQGMAVNLLEVACRGETMVFLVNGIQLAEVRDSSYPRGGVGLYAGSFFEPGVEIHFDDWRVDSP
jgi:major membrane immunogen (membrane-anchored lipoprotein)